MTYTRIHRILHWLIAFTFLFMMLTVYLRMYWMNKEDMPAVIHSKLGQNNIRLSANNEVSVAKALRGVMWKWHIYAGYVLLGLYAIRLIVMGIQGVPFKNPFRKNLDRKERFKSIIYLVFYICLGISLVTGAFINLSPAAWHSVASVMKNIHVQSMYYSVAFIALHLGGLVIAELSGDRGIISKMINGG